jgi:hypothetical protein
MIVPVNTLLSLAGAIHCVMARKSANNILPSQLFIAGEWSVLTFANSQTAVAPHLPGSGVATAATA